MSNEPIVFKRTKSKPPQRARLTASDLNDERQPSSFEVTATEEEPSGVIATKSKKKLKTRSKPRSGLSFGGDDEEGQGEVFQVKKSSLSRKLALGRAGASLGSILPSPFDPFSASPPASNGRPIYDANYLSELKASTPTARLSQQVAQASCEADSSIANDISMADDSVDSFDASFAPETNEMEIPTSSYILAAKKKRDTLRTTGDSGDEFISLSLTKGIENLGPHPESRLVREEDELGEADDEFAEYTSAQERIALGKKARTLAASQRREEMQVAIEDTREDDEEEMEWEQEQLRRGGHRGQTPESQAPVKVVYKPAPIPPITPIPTLEPVILRLRQSLTTLITSHAQNTSSMNGLAEEQLQLEAKEKELRQMIERTEAKRSWFVAFREWVEGVASFLDEKFPQLEKLEDEHLSLLKEKSDMISDRRRTDDKDDLSLLFGALQQPQDGQSSTSTLHERSAARTQHRLQRRRKPSVPPSEEGYSTDSSLPPSESHDFQIALAKLQEKVANVLSDVRAEGFRVPKIGLGKWFGEWRERYEDIYVGAWGGLGLIGAWEFWARLEIVGWNPFQDKSSLDGFDWYEGLYEYSRPPRPDNDVPEGDAEFGPEGDLVSAMILTAIVPRLCKLVEGGGFDPYSARNVRAMTDLAEQVETAVRDTANPKFQMLLKSVYIVFQNAVDAEKSLLASYLDVNVPRFNPEAIPARKRYLNRRIKLIEGMVRWRRYSGDKFGMGELVKRVVNEIIVPVAEGGWEVGGDECLTRLATVLPKELMTPMLTMRLGRA